MDSSATVGANKLDESSFPGYAVSTSALALTVPVPEDRGGGQTIRRHYIELQFPNTLQVGDMVRLVAPEKYILKSPLAGTYGWDMCMGPLPLGFEYHRSMVKRQKYRRLDLYDGAQTDEDGDIEAYEDS